MTVKGDAVTIRPVVLEAVESYVIHILTVKLKREGVQVQVNSSPHACIPSNWYYKLKKKVGDDKVLICFLRQIQKLVNFTNILEMSTFEEENKNEILHAIAAGGDKDSVMNFAKIANVSVGDLGHVLVPREMLMKAGKSRDRNVSTPPPSTSNKDTVKDKSPPPESSSSSSSGEGSRDTSPLASSQHSVANSVALLAKEDFISGFKVLPSAKLKLKQVGDKGESKVHSSIVTKLGIDESDFLTEKQLKVLQDLDAISQTVKKRLPTPDFLLKRKYVLSLSDGTVIEANWIDSKNCFLVPSLSSPSELSSLLAQIKKYCEIYGSGIIVWLRGFTPSIVEFTKDYDVTHVSI